MIPDKQPADAMAVEIDRSNEFAKGLVAYWLPYQIGMLDLVSGQWVPSYSDGESSLTEGRAKKLQSPWPTTPAGIRALPFSGYQIIYHPGSLADWEYPIDNSSYTSESDNQGWGITFKTTKTLNFDIFNNNGGTTYGFNTGYDVSAAGVYRVGFKAKSTFRRVYVGNQVVGTKTEATTMAAGPTTYSFSNWQSYTFVLILWDRFLNNKEMRNVNRNPYQLLKPRGSV